MHRADGLVAHRLALGAGQPGNAEVHHLDGAVRQQHDVLGFHIPVDDALGVGVVQRAEHLRGKMHGLLPGERAAALFEVFLQRDAVHIFHNDVLELVRHRHIVHLDDVGMVQNGDGLGLVFETAHQFLVVQKLFFQNLDSHRVAGLGILTPVDVGHAAHADQVANEIPAVQTLADQIIHVVPPYPPHPSAER